MSTESLMPAEPEFDGYFNNWGGGSLVTGWVFAQPNACTDDITIDARLDGASIGHGVGHCRNADGRGRFRIECQKRFDPIDVVIGRLRLYAALPGTPEREIRAHESLLTWMAKVAFNENIVAHIRDLDAAKYLIERIESRFGPSLLTERGLETPSQPPTDIERDLTAFKLRTGTISPDRSAILGQNGTILLYEGGNKLFSQYQQANLTQADESRSEQWTKLVADRVRHFQSAGIPFVQTIIPEKSTVLAHLYPVPVRTPTRLLESLETWARIHRDMLGPCFLSLHDSFRTAPVPERLFLKTDSHFSARGAMETTLLMLTALAKQHFALGRAMTKIDALLSQAQSPRAAKRILTGDLAARFFGVPLFEEDIDVSTETLLGHSSAVMLVEEILPPAGSVNGRRMVWHHENAPLDLRVMACGNSFFERGSRCTGLSWWFKHLCREFHFVWSKELDYEYVERVKPDLVIAQTIERFLTVVPAT